MIVAFDNTFLSLAVNPNTPPTPNPATGEPIDYCIQRVEALIDDLAKRGDTILVPTPCMSEMLVAAPDFEDAVEMMYASSAFEVAAFDARGAVELARINREARDAGDKRSGVSAKWNEVKFDRQIAAIAKVERASILYTDDSNQTKFAKLIGLSVKHTWDLELPESYRQTDLLKQSRFRGRSLGTRNMQLD